MTTQKLIKCYDFGKERIRSKLTFSDPTKIRLNPETGRLELSQQGVNRATGQPIYSTDPDLHITIAETNPQSLFRWAGLDVVPRPSDQPAGASVQLRFNDGTSDLFWDGAAWATAGASDWNDLVTVAANFSTFPAQDQKLIIKVNLVTTDRLVTPSVAYIDLLMECRIQYLESLIARSFIPSLKEKVRPLVEVAVHGHGNDKISLRGIENNPNIVSVEAVYDKTSDPDKQTNLLSSYDPSSKVVTLTGAVTRGNEVRIEFISEPEVYLNFTSQDYVEVEKIPAVVLDSFTVEGNEIFAQYCVADISNNTATVRRAPFRLALEFQVLLLAQGNRVLLRMMDQALEHAATTTLLVWKDLDEEVTLKMIEEGNFSSRPNLSDIHQTSYTLRFEDVFLWLRPAEVMSVIRQLNITLSSPDLQGGPRWTGVR